MPQRKSGKEELKKNIVRHKRNLVRKNELKTALKKFRRTVESKDSDASREALTTLYKTLDRAAAKKLIHPNKASRKKSRLTAQVNKLQSASS